MNYGRDYRFTLYVELPGREQMATAFMVEAFAAKHAKWEPYDLCSDATMAVLADGVTSLGAARIDTERQKLAEDVSTQLTHAILKAIKSRDLRNGYEHEHEKH